MKKNKSVDIDVLFPIDEEVENVESMELESEEVGGEKPTTETEEPLYSEYDQIAKEAFEKAYIKEQKSKRRRTDLLRFVAMIVILSLVFRFVIGLAFVSGDSMKPTLRDHNVAVYNRLDKTLDKNDIAAIQMEDKVLYVKRVVATEGDTVDIRDGQVYVNGSALEEDYTQGFTKKISKGNITYPLTVGKDQVFVLGDNREHSVDSRTFGVVYKYQIKGRLLYYIGKAF